MSNLLIRNVTIDDLDIIYNIEKECFPESEAASYEAFKDRIYAFPESFFVAELDNEIIGFINGGITDKDTLEDEFYHDLSQHNPNGAYQTVFGLDVLPKYQHKGYASLLMDHLINISKERNKKGIMLTCKDYLVGFYQKFGYEHLGVSESSHGGAKWNDMLITFK